MPGNRDFNLQPGRHGGRAEVRRGAPALRIGRGRRGAIGWASLLSRLAVGVIVGAIGTAGCGSEEVGGPGVVPPPPPASRPTLDPAYRPSGHAAAGDVFVHLFEWKWTDVAAECEDALGPAGYRAVQVSPPQEHIVLDSHPWWVRYQPVSYSLERSRSGTGAEFEGMVNRCRAAGVDIYVDAVINHMTAGAGTGSAGSTYTKYRYPGLYEPTDFHPACAVADYQDEANVQDCELLGLADLDTGSEAVRVRIADYLIGLVELGVAGFRLDAAKHVQPVELDAILDRVVEAARAGGRATPWFFAEVIDHGGEAARAADYFGLAFGSGGAAEITEFRYRGIADKFAGVGGQRPADLSGFSSAAWNLMPSDKAVVFVQNHDTQRSGGLDYRDGAPYRLANIWMLAWPYGYPKVMSGYAFIAGAGRDDGPPSEGAGATRDVSCAAAMEAAMPGEWTCEHRDPSIAAMVGFRRATAGTEVVGWWDDGEWSVAFSRGDRGFVALTLASAGTTLDVATPLPAGTYCDLLTGGLRDGSCVGRTIEVASDGRVAADLAAGEAVAIHVGERL